MTNLTSTEALICSLLIKNANKNPQFSFLSSNMLCKEALLLETELTQLLNSMQEKGYIIMLQNTSNNNSYYISLTPKGRAAYEKTASH